MCIGDRIRLHNRWIERRCVMCIWDRIRLHNRWIERRCVMCIGDRIGYIVKFTTISLASDQDRS